MGGPGLLAVKLNVYTLFCRQFLVHLLPLHDAIRGDLQLTIEHCVTRFDEPMQQFFGEAAPQDLMEGVGLLGGLLRSRAELFRAQNARAADVFHWMVEKAGESASAWRYQEDLQEFHDQGRQLARRFYEGSPWPATRSRLDQQSDLVFCTEEEDFPNGDWHYRPAPMAFWNSYQYEDQDYADVILVRFGFDCDFGLYLSYPFLFMHEYTAHIIACDHDNERFNDGWLLYAANAFLVRCGWGLQPPLCREQIGAFDERLWGELRRGPREAYRFAKAFDDWLRDPERFQAITWELAAFEPHTDKDKFWPDQFLNRLEEAFEHDRSRLLDKIRAASDVRRLHEMLPSV
jgi:hypothetical protein